MESLFYFLMNKRSLSFIWVFFNFFLFKDFIYLFLERGKGREKDSERNMDMWNINQLTLACPHPGTWPPTQACALTGNQTRDLSVCGRTPSPVSHTSQGFFNFFQCCFAVFNIKILIFFVKFIVMYLFFSVILYINYVS